MLVKYCIDNDVHCYGENGNLIGYYHLKVDVFFYYFEVIDMQKLLLISAMSMALLAGCGDDHKPVSMADLPKENAIGFSVNSEAFIATDKVLIDLSITKRGNDTTALTQEVNSITAEVFKVIQTNKAVESKTTFFTTGPYYSSMPNATPETTPSWEVSQGLHLESTDSKALSRLVASIQNKVQVTSVSYDLSNQAATTAKQAMTQTALKAFRERAKTIAKDMGYERYRIINMNIQAWDDAGAPYASAVAGGNVVNNYKGPVANENNSALVLEGGKNLYRLTVSGQVVVPSK